MSSSRTLLLVAVMLLAVSVQAQSRGDLSLSFFMGLPQGEFAEHVDDLGYGIGLTAGGRIPQTPLVVGIDGSFMLYGHDNREEILSPNIPEVTVDVTTTNNIVNTHAFVRLESPEGRVRPYLEGLFGFKYLFTQTSINDDNHGNEEPVFSSVNFDDWALSYGTGGGLKFQVFSGKMGDLPGRASLQITMGARYIFGGTAEYLREGSITRNNGNLQFDVQRSRTNVLTPFVAFGVGF